MKATTKRVLTISITAVCSVALALIIGFAFPGEDANENVTIDGYSYDMNADAQVAVPEGEDYESMSKEELLAVIEEKDAEIEELVDKVEALTILAEQTTNSIVVPRPSSSTEENGENTEEKSSSSNSSSSSSSSSGSSSNGTTSDTGL